MARRRAKDKKVVAAFSFLQSMEDPAPVLNYSNRNPGSQLSWHHGQGHGYLHGHRL